MNALANRVLAWSQAFSIRFKIMGLAGGMVLVMGLSAALLAQAGISQTTSAELERRGASIALDVATRGTDLLLTHNAIGLHDLLQETLQNNEDLRYVVVLDARGKVASHTFPGGFPTDLLTLPVPNQSQRTLVQLLNTEEGRLHDVAVPILDGRAGTVRVGMSPQRIQRQAMNLTEWLVATVLLVAGFALVGAFVLTTILTRPIVGLVEASKAAAAGNLGFRAPPGPPDEVGLLVTSFNEMLVELEAAQNIKNELLNRVISAQEEERRRIARELHDETSQAITSLVVGLRTLEEDLPAVRERSIQLRHLASSTLDEIHSLILELRPRALDELGLVPALRRYVADFGQKTGILTEFQSVGSGQRLPPQVETCLYRMVQEALTNVARHSEAHTASVVVDTHGGVATAIIEDDGRGFEMELVSNERSLGLLGMRERASLLHGSLQIESSPARGTSVFIKIPIEERRTWPFASS